MSLTPRTTNTDMQLGPIRKLTLESGSQSVFLLFPQAHLTATNAVKVGEVV